MEILSWNSFEGTEEKHENFGHAVLCRNSLTTSPARSVNVITEERIHSPVKQWDHKLHTDTYRAMK
jgi:hypothetical protein